MTFDSTTMPLRARLFRAAALPSLAAFALAVLAPRQVLAQEAPGDDLPTRSPQAQPAAPQPAPGAPAPGTTVLRDNDAPPSPPPNLTLRPGDEIPPLPPGTVAAPGYPTPARYKIAYQERRMTGLMAAGLGVFGGAWFMSAVFGGYVSDRGWFVLPVFGPVIYKSDDKSQQAALIMDTIVQASGVAMALAGAFVKEKVAVRQPVTVAPLLLKDGGGLGVMGRW